VLIEELLQFFIGKVNANLLKTIVVKDLKASNIQASDVLNFLHAGVNQSHVASVNNEAENTLIDRSTDTRHRAGCSGTSLTLRDPLGSDLELRLTEIGDEPLSINLCAIQKEKREY